jgi:hypothetical protein
MITVVIPNKQSTTGVQTHYDDKSIESKTAADTGQPPRSELGNTPKSRSDAGLYVERDQDQSPDAKDVDVITVGNTDDELEGFIPQKRRQKLTALYVAGIVVKESTDKTIQCLYKYLDGKNMYVRSIRYVKERGNTLAVKIVIQQTDSEQCVNDGFWPQGIWCRQWLN